MQPAAAPVEGRDLQVLAERLIAYLYSLPGNQAVRVAVFLQEDGNGAVVVRGVNPQMIARTVPHLEALPGGGGGDA